MPGWETRLHPAPLPKQRKRITLIVAYNEVEDGMEWEYDGKDFEIATVLEKAWYVEYQGRTVSPPFPSPGPAVEYALRWATDRGYESAPLGIDIDCVKKP